MGAGAASGARERPLACVGGDVTFDTRAHLCARRRTESRQPLSAGRITFDRLVGADPNVVAVFDYYVTFDEEDTTVAGPARWGDLPVVARVDSDDVVTLYRGVN